MTIARTTHAHIVALLTQVREAVAPSLTLNANLQTLADFAAHHHAASGPPPVALIDTALEDGAVSMTLTVTIPATIVDDAALRVRELSEGRGVLDARASLDQLTPVEWLTGALSQLLDATLNSIAQVAPATVDVHTVQLSPAIAAHAAAVAAAQAADGNALAMASAIDVAPPGTDVPLQLFAVDAARDVAITRHVRETARTTVRRRVLVAAASAEAAAALTMREVDHVLPLPMVAESVAECVEWSGQVIDETGQLLPQSPTCPEGGNAFDPGTLTASAVTVKPFGNADAAFRFAIAESLRHAPVLYDAPGLSIPDLFARLSLGYPPAPAAP